jgi:hypothetical protein
MEEKSKGFVGEGKELGKHEEKEFFCRETIRGTARAMLALSSL